MTQLRTRIPAAAELLDAVAGFLEQELLPVLEGRQKFNTRVSINALRIVQRELLQPAPESGIAELQALLGRPGGALEELLLDLATRIRNGEFRENDLSLLKLLRALTRARLAVDNPKYVDVRPLP